MLEEAARGGATLPISAVHLELLEQAEAAGLRRSGQQRDHSRYSRSTAAYAGRVGVDEPAACWETDACRQTRGATVAGPFGEFRWSMRTMSRSDQCAIALRFFSRRVCDAATRHRRDSGATHPVAFAQGDGRVTVAIDGLPVAVLLLPGREDHAAIFRARACTRTAYK